MANALNHAVKALIHRPDGRILMQQRDLFPHLLFPGYWTFFGGLVEPGESLKEALARELQEELGQKPETIGDELCAWAWMGQDAALNHCFPVTFGDRAEALALFEGNAMAWCTVDEITNLKIVPGIVANLVHIRAFFKKQ